MNMFEQATRLKFRFMSSKGELSAEQLWDVPLRSKDDFNLDNIARGVNRALEAACEESFVDTVQKNPTRDILAGKLNIVKHVIGVKVYEEREAKERADNKVEREKLLAILAEKQEGKLSELSERELKRRIEALKPEASK